MALENSVISGGGGSQVYFVDASLPGYQGLVSSLGEGSRVFVIENTSDAFAQMDAALASLTDPVAGLHIYSHGREGALFLGGQWIDEAALANGKANTLASIGNYLTEDGDILLYGCYTGAGVVGESFMAQLARLTRADVAASSNLTGLGGDWVLENKTGPIESGPVQPDWEGMLNAGGTVNWGIIQGTSGNDSLTGFVSNDRFYGNGGNDTMTGGDGNDAYYITDGITARVENTLIVEKDGTNGGIDTVFSRVGYFDLGAGVANVGADSSAVEYIILQAQAGMEVQSAKGTLYDQTLMGNALDNNLTGGGGNNYLFGDAGNDNLDGGNGKLVSVTVNVDFDTDDRNTLVGGTGDDNYVIRNKRDIIIETSVAGGGIDNVYSYVDHTLSNYVENLTLLDEGNATYGGGNSLANVITGTANAFSNWLDGGAGNDTLYGKVGDTLLGGTGDDLLVIREGLAGGSGAIIDGGAGTDTLRFDGTTGQNVTVNVNGFGSTVNSLLDIPGNVSVYGIEAVVFGAGHDIITLTSLEANAKMSIDGGAGNDTLRFADTYGYGVTLNAANLGTSLNALGGLAYMNGTTRMAVASATATNIEHLDMSQSDGNDTISVSSTTRVFTLNAGDGGAPGYTVNSTGIYSLDAGAGNDSIVVASISNTQRILGGAGVVSLKGGLGNDTISLTGAVSYSRLNITGDEGEDRISLATVSGSGVTIDGGTENDTITIASVALSKRSLEYTPHNSMMVSVVGGEGDDSISIGAVTQSELIVRGDEGNDTINITSFDPESRFTIEGGAGKDVINVSTMKGVGSWGTSYIRGGEGNDNISIKSVTDATVIGSQPSMFYITGDAGADTITIDSISKSYVTISGGGYTPAVNVGDPVGDYGNDTAGDRISIGTVSASGLNIYGDAGDETISINSIANTNQFVLVNAGKGNDNVSVGTISGGTVNIGGTGGNNTISVGAITGGDVYMAGGVNYGEDGNDVFYLGNVNTGATVHVDGGNDTDTLNFTGGAVEMRVFWDSYRNVGDIIKMNGQTLHGAVGDVIRASAWNVEYFTGSNGNDTFSAENWLRGNLTLDGAAGNDSITMLTVMSNIAALGGAGNDTLRADAVGVYNNSTHAGFAIGLTAGNLTMDGGAGTDNISIGTVMHGNVSIDGGADNDTIIVNNIGAGADVTGGIPENLLSGLSVAVNINAGAGNDSVSIGAIRYGNVTLDGGGGTADTLNFGTASSVTLNVGATGGVSIVGNTSVTINNFEYYQGTGALAFAGTSGTSTGVNLSMDSAGVATYGTSKFAGFSSVDGSAYNDTLNVGAYTVGAGKSLYVNGGAGDDFVEIGFNSIAGTVSATGGDGGTDTLSFGAGADRIVFGNDGSIKHYNHASNTATSNTSNWSFSGFEVYTGGAGNDTLNASLSNAARTLSGGAGTDVIYGSAHGDVIYLDGGNDTIHLNTTGVDASDVLTMMTSAAGGSSTVNGFSRSKDCINEQALIDADWKRTVSGTTNAVITWKKTGSSDIVVTLVGVPASAISEIFGIPITVDNSNVYTAAGNENRPLVITANNAGNSIIGGNSADIIKGGTGADQIYGGLGNDRIYWDTVSAGASTLTLNGSNTVTVPGVRGYGGDGNDTLSVGSVANGGAITLDGGAGNDSIYVGNLTSLMVTVNLNGGEGVDTLHLNYNGTSNYRQRFILDDSGSGAVSYYTSTINSDFPVSSFSISGFEYYKGNDNGNRFYAGAYTATPVTLEGGAGDDILEVYKGRLIGNAGNDLLILKDVISGVSVSGGTYVWNVDYGAHDTLRFDNANDMRATLNSANFAQDSNIFTNLAYMNGNVQTSIAANAIGIEVMQFGSGNDSINVTGAGYFRLSTGAGNDTITVADTLNTHGSGGPAIYAGAGNDDISVGTIGGINNVRLSIYSDRDNPESSVEGGGNDTIMVNSVANGELYIWSGGGNDSVVVKSVGNGSGGESARVTIATNSGNETVNDGNNIVIVNSINKGGVTISGGYEADNISIGTATGGSVNIRGDAGNDVISIDSVNGCGVSIRGDDGNDRINLGNVTSGTTNYVSIHGGNGSDSLYFTGGAVSMSMSSRLVEFDDRWHNVADIHRMNGTTVNNVSAAAIQYYQGGSGNDTFIATSNILADLTLNGGAGNDSIVLGTVVDTERLVSWDGETSVFETLTAVAAYGGDGNDILTAVAVGDAVSMGHLTLDGGAGNDDISIGSMVRGVASIAGGAGADTIRINTISGGTISVNGGDGNDSISVSTIADGAIVYITGGAGDDTIDARGSGTGSHTTAMTLSGGAGNDVIYGSAHGDNIWLDGGNDTIHLSTANSGAGVDILTMTSLNGNSTVNSFSLINDRIDDSALTGWTRNITRSDGTATANATVTWTNGSNTVSVVLMGVGQGDITFTTQGAEAITVNMSGEFTADPLTVPWLITGLGNNTITGGDMADTIIGNGTGNNSIDGGAGNDSISIGGTVPDSAILYVNGGDGDDLVQIGHVDTNASVSLYGGYLASDTGDADTLYLNSTVDGQGQAFTLEPLGGGYVQYHDITQPTNITSPTLFFEGFEHIKGNDFGNMFYAGAYTDKAITLEGGAGNDTLEIYTGQLIGGKGDDVLILKNVAGGVQATVVGENGDGDDKVKLFGVTGVSGSNVDDLNSCSLVFKKDANGDVLMSFAGANAGTDTNILTFNQVYGQDTLSFYSGQDGAGKLFGGDVDLDQLYGFVTSNPGFSDNDWHGVTFTGTGTYTASAVKT